jgi:methanogenic corrinoid protein MtbC1
MGSFGYNLKRLRKEKKLSQKNIAELIGVGQTTIANYENDQRFPNPPMLAQLADILDVSLDTLIGREANRRPPEENLEDYTEQFIDLVLGYQEEAAIELVMDMAKRGHDVLAIYEHFLKKTLYKVGDLWEAGKVSVPMEHHITDVIDRILVLLSPFIQAKSANGKTAIFIAPSNEPHLIGLKIVKETFRQYGWKTLFVGNSVPWQSLIDWIEEHGVDLVVISTTMKDNRNQIEAMLDYIRFRTHAKVMLGGQAYTLKDYFLEQVKPDYYSNSVEELYQILKAIS